MSEEARKVTGDVRMQASSGEEMSPITTANIGKLAKEFVFRQHVPNPDQAMFTRERVNFLVEQAGGMGALLERGRQQQPDNPDKIFNRTATEEK